jgi:L-2,4-diaminobutyrate decarboxylase
MDFRDEGISLGELTALVDKCLVPHLVQYDRPEFHSLYNCFPEEGAKFGARVAVDYNQGVTNWQVSPGGVMMEELCCQALCRLFGFPAGADATFMYCGTYANQQALYLALHRKAEQYGFNLGETGIAGFPDPGRLVVLASREAHFSLRHALRIIGLGDNSLITVPVDQNRRLAIGELHKILGNIKKTKEVFAIVSTAGTTSSGSIDPVLPLAETAEKQKAWLHVDGAYGFAFSLLPEYKYLFSGINRADSVCWDPHKQFGVPIPNSLLFLRERKDFLRMAIYGDYFNREVDPEPNPGLKSPPSTRPFSALPLVTSIQYRGMKKVIKGLRAPMEAIRDLAEKLKDEADIEVCHRPDTGILCIRYVPEGFPEDQLDKLQKYIYDKIKAEGKRSISMTRFDEKTVLRFVAISPAVTGDAMMDTISYIRFLFKNR